jgi:hypothetical protein
MNPTEPPVPARRNVPVVVAVFLAALAALGLAFVWPWG